MQDEITRDDEDREYESRLSEKLQVFGSRLQGMVAQRVADRAQVEQRWLRDLRQYNGKYDPEEEERLKKADGSRIFVNITRNKSNAAEARLSDMLFPTDDRNWGIRPTPVPELNSLAEQPDTEQGATAVEIIKQARKMAEGMQREIDDQLTESGYAAKCRDMIHDAVVLGTGVIKGPVVVGRARERWDTDEQGVSVLEMDREFRPDSQYVDIWNFYPDMAAATVADCDSFLERHSLTKRQLIRLAQNPGFLEDQVRKVVTQDPRTSQSSKPYEAELREFAGVSNVIDDRRYEMWEYTGPIEKDELEAAGAEVDDDPLTEYYGTVLFVNGIVLKVSIHPMDTEDDLYRVFNWEKDRSSLFGYGVPYLMRNPQRVINASWRMILDNGGLSTGPQIVADKDAIEPADGDWTIKPRKLWHKKKSQVSVGEVFAVHHIQNNQGELLNIFTQARQLADEETNLPLIAQGEQAGHITDTAHGMNMLMNSANIVLRRAVKNFDDDVTRPHITSYYNWNMQFSDKPEIKGDFTIDARGSGALLAREMQKDALMQLAMVADGNEEFAMRTDWEGLYGEIVKHMQVSKEAVVLSKEAFEENMKKRQEAGPDIDPIKQAELQLKQQSQQMEHEHWQQEFQAEQEQWQAELAMKHELEMMRMAQDQDITLEKLRTQLGIKEMDVQTKRDIEAGKQTLAQAQLINERQNLRQGYDTYG